MLLGEEGGGRTGVFQSWGETAPLVNGVAGAVYKRFGDFESALDFLQRYEASNFKVKEAPTGEAMGSNYWYAVMNPGQDFYQVYPSWPEAMPHVTGVKGAMCKKYRSYDDALDHLESSKVEVGEARGRSSSGGRGFKKEAAKKEGTVQGYYPPDVLVGPDPSMGDEDKLFEIGVNMGESELRNALCPSDLTGAVAKGLMNATIDVVSMPGGFFGRDMSQASSELGILGEAVEELVNQRQGSSESSGRMDLHWRNKDRTSIRSIKNVEMLRKRIVKLQKLQPKAIKRMVQASLNAMKRDGVVEPARIAAWGTRGFATRLVTDTLNLYLALHQHLLMDMANEQKPWAYIRVEVDHHVEELELIRQTSKCRLQCLGSVYIYLRDMSEKNWHCNSLQNKRNMELYDRTEGVSGVEDESDDESDTEGGVSWACCVHCGTCHHVGGKETCPWSLQDKDDAKKSGAAAMRKLAKPKKKLRGGKGAKK
jgi:hypothetical protein